jgi:hypothetical protein
MQRGKRKTEREKVAQASAGQFANPETSPTIELSNLA